MQSLDTSRREKDLRKIKLKYEIMARNELNAKLSDINAFLEQRSVEQTENEKKRDQVTEAIQKDLGTRLQQSRDELLVIKNQMRGELLTY